MSDKENNIPELTGHVVSAAMEKTIVVRIDRKFMHPLYGKSMKRSTKLMAHDPEGLASKGDKVRIKSGRPISKNKSWRLSEVIEKVIG